jgi:uncharacterized protein YdaU (DUF1376 family)
MSLPKRCRSFLFEPSAFLNDPAVLRMTLQEVGAYSILLFTLWDMPKPGVIEDNDVVLARASRSGAEWPSLRLGISRAFDTVSKPGFWVQKRLASTFASQSHRFRLKKTQAKLAAKARWDRTKDAASIADAMQVSDSVSDSDSVSVLGSSLKDQKRKTKTCPPAADALEGFEEFYREYPRKVKRPDAVKAWRGIKNRDLDSILVGLGRWKEYWARGDPQFIKHPGSFLRNRMWEDNPISATNGNGFHKGKGALLMELGRRMKEAETNGKA